MQKKVVPFGTTHNVVVESASANLLSVVATEINEGFFLVGHGMTILPEKGDKGKIVFVEGGPMRGYWKFQKEKK